MHTCRALHRQVQCTCILQNSIAYLQTSQACNVYARYLKSASVKNVLVVLPLQDLGLGYCGVFVVVVVLSPFLRCWFVCFFFPSFKLLKMQKKETRWFQSLNRQGYCAPYTFLFVFVTHVHQSVKQSVLSSTPESSVNSLGSVLKYILVLHSHMLHQLI